MHHDEPISSETMTALKAGAEDAFAHVYEIYAPRLFARLVKLVKNEEDARELLQEIFFRVWRKRDTLDLEKSFSAYLFRIAENLACDYFRKLAREKKMRGEMIREQASAFLAAEDELTRYACDGLLEKAISQLPPRRREIFRRCKIERKSYEETARELGVSPSTISDHIVKATRFIRDYCALHQEALFALALCGTLTLH